MSEILCTEPKLGVLGGMGPQATQVFYQYVLDRTDASCDQEHLPTLILSDTLMPDRTKAILSGETEPTYQRLLKDALRLHHHRHPLQHLPLLCGSAAGGDLHPHHPYDSGDRALSG